jgi:hypothetical protein
MSADNVTPGHDAQDAPIVPVAYSPPDPAAHRTPPRRPGKRQILIGAALLAIVLFAGFLLSAEALRVETEPPDARVDIDGGLHLVLGGSVLIRPGDYLVHAEAPGYRALEQPLRVKEDGGGVLSLRLEKLPGLLALRTEPVAARVLLDGAGIGSSNGAELEIPAGLHRLRVEADRFPVTRGGLLELPRGLLRLARCQARSQLIEFARALQTRGGARVRGIDRCSLTEGCKRCGLIARGKGRVAVGEACVEPGRDAVKQRAQRGFAFAVTLCRLREARFTVCGVTLLRERGRGIELCLGPVVGLALLEFVLKGEQGVQGGLCRCALALGLCLLPR